MKKILLPLAAFALLMACNSGGDSKEKGETNANDITKNPDYQKGLELV